MGDGVIPTRWFGDCSPEDMPLGNARGCQRRFEIFEDVDEILRKGEPHRGIGKDEFSVFTEEGATVRGTAEYLGPVLEPVLPWGGHIFQEERVLGGLLGV